jgi:isopenicillin N synthase-like dioxygenase
MVYNSLKLGKTAAKARLLYYFPPGQQKHQQTEEENVEDDPVFDDWCGWHTDHGSLTALLPGLLCDEEEEATGISHNEKDDRLKKQSASSSTSSSYPKPGLYIQTNSNLGKKNDSDKSQQQQQQTELVHVKLSPNSLGFQLGETLQIMSKGKFIATPHAVKAPPSRSMNTKKIGRASLAVFLQPLSNQRLPPLVDIDEKSSSSPSSSLQKEQNDYDDDFSLRRRWRSTFGEFQRVTTEAFN